MSRIQAVLVDPNAPARLSLGEKESPSPAPHEALVQVAAFSLNRGEVNRSQSAEAGFNPGWDLAGKVERAAADGSGPPEGSRVVGLMSSSGAWAELVAVPTVALAEIPENVSFTDAATLPVAGLTALYALERGGNLLGRTVLVTGASGGAGDFALRLGRLSGGRVVALVRRAEHEPIAREAGAHEVAVGEPAEAARFGPYDLILDSVGGPVLGEALSMLAADGSCVTFGGSASYDVTFDVRDFYLTGGASLHGFILFHEVLSRPASVGLARLTSLVAERRLTPRIEVEASWKEVGEVARRLLDRGFTGKAVLHVED